MMALSVGEVIRATFDEFGQYTVEAQEELSRYYHSYLASRKRGQWLLENQRNYQLWDTIDLSGKKILDIGSGCGSESIAFASFGAKVTSMDVKPSRVNAAKERARQLLTSSWPDFGLGSVFDIKQRDFDIIWMNQAYHHVEPRIEFIELLAGLIAPGGRIWISESNSMNPVISGSLFLKRGSQRVVEKKDENGHVFLYGNENVTYLARLEKDFAKFGFRRNQSKHYRMFPNKDAFLNKVCGHLNGLSVPFLNTHYTAEFLRD